MWKERKKNRSCVLADLHKEHLQTNLSQRQRLLLSSGSTRGGSVCGSAVAAAVALPSQKV